MLALLHAGILGIVEGFTEFLPISSTAHLILASNILKIAQTDYQKSFEIIIQLGAILAVIFLYWRSFLNLEILKRIIVAFIPTGIVGLTFYKIVKTYFLGNTSIVLWSLALGGLCLIIFERFFKEKKEEIDVTAISYLQCIKIGFFQSIAIIPGVSRSAATILGGLSLGIPRKTIVEFSFLLAVPTMLAATGLDLLKNASSFNGSQFQFLTIGFILAFITAIISIRFLLNFIKNKNFTWFGVYRIVLVGLFLIF